MSYPTHGPEYHERDSWKRPARAATTANITIATGLNAGDSIDGVTLAAGDRVLVKDQTAADENGIYIAGASPARAADFASSAEIVGAAIVVTEGTANGGKAWLCDTPAPITVGSDDITFAALGSGSAGVTTWKEPARAATTGNVTIATGLNVGDAIDGVTLASGDRVLVKDQTAADENGVYVAGASPSRATDADSTAELVGAALVVTEGTANGGTAWLCTTPAPIVVGTDDITFGALGAGTGGSDPHITGSGTGTVDFPAGTETINLVQPGNLAGLQVDEGGGTLPFIFLFAGVSDDAGLYVQEDYVQIQVPAAPGALSGLGFALNLGTDGLALLFSEKDITAIQAYTYDDVHVELVDSGASHFKHVTDAGDESIPALGILRTLAAAPSGPVEGESYYDTTLHKTRTWDGTTWQNHW